MMTRETKLLKRWILDNFKAKKEVYESWLTDAKRIGGLEETVNYFEGKIDAITAAIETVENEYRIMFGEEGAENESL